MANDVKQTTPIPGAVQSKMREGVRQRYAMGTTPSANPEKGKGK